MEYRVYGVNVSLKRETPTPDYRKLTNEQWMELSEQDGLVWSLDNFAWQFDFNQIENPEDIWIRFININQNHL